MVAPGAGKPINQRMMGAQGASHLGTWETTTASQTASEQDHSHKWRAPGALGGKARTHPDPSQPAKDQTAPSWRDESKSARRFCSRERTKPQRSDSSQSKFRAPWGPRRIHLATVSRHLAASPQRGRKIRPSQTPQSRVVKGVTPHRIDYVSLSSFSRRG